MIRNISTFTVHASLHHLDFCHFHFSLSEAFIALYYIPFYIAYPSLRSNEKKLKLLNRRRIFFVKTFLSLINNEIFQSDLKPQFPKILPVILVTLLLY